MDSILPITSGRQFSLIMPGLWGHWEVPVWTKSDFDNILLKRHNERNILQFKLKLKNLSHKMRNSKYTSPIFFCYLPSTQTEAN